MKHRPRKRFGQNFLRDTEVIGRIVAAINPQKEDHIVEIGPGQGALTALVIEAVKRLDIIEIDKDLVKILTTKWGTAAHCTIHSSDALQFDFSTLRCTDLRIIGNLPYNISTPLLFHLLAYSEYIRDMFLMLQNEVVERLCANTGTRQYGRLSVMTQYYCDVEKMFIVKPEAFTPTPRVDSAIVRLIPGKERKPALLNDESLALIVRTAFSQRRKTIKNALRNILSEAELNKLDIAPKARAENLSIAQFTNMANYWKQKTGKV